MNIRILTLACAVLLAWTSPSESKATQITTFESVYTQVLKEVRYLLMRQRVNNVGGLETAKGQLIKKQFAELQLGTSEIMIVDPIDLRNRVSFSGPTTLIRAVYFPFDGSHGTLYLASDLDILNNGCDQAILAHELVHHLQYEFIQKYQPETYARYAAEKHLDIDDGHKVRLENETYEIQRQWMEANRGNAPGQILHFKLSGILGNSCMINPLPTQHRADATVPTLQIGVRSLE